MTTFFYGFYQGPVSHDILQDYYDNSSHSPANQLAYFRYTPLIKQTSLFLRLFDFQRDGHQSHKFDLSSLDTSYLPDQESLKPAIKTKKSLMTQIYSAAMMKVMFSKAVSKVQA